MIDLHTHTTASDGRLTPAALVARAAENGVTVLAVTDHDTTAACAEAAAACARAGMTFVNGIEITSVKDQVDVHVLGYFVDVSSRALADFLAQQRQRRLERLARIVETLAGFGIVLDADAILEPARADPSRSAGRPWIARAMVAAGHALTTDDAFARWLSRGKPAFVPRLAAEPAEVFALIRRAGGISSIAHPGLLDRDEWLDSFAADGVDALEAYHSDHDGAATERYLAAAARLGLAVTGGSDFHADGDHGAPRPGIVSLPRERYDELVRRAGAAKRI